MVSKVWSFNGQQWWMRKGEEKQRGRWEELLNFSEWGERTWLLWEKKMISFSYYFIFLKHLPLVPFWVEQKGAHFFSWCDSYSATRREKNLTFWMLKSCLGLRAISLIPISRVSLHSSGPVFESKQYIYQNAQNETLSVVQRLVLLNY